MGARFLFCLCFISGCVLGGSGGEGESSPTAESPGGPGGENPDPDAGAKDEPPLPLEPTSYRCTQVIGFSQSLQWYTGTPGFEAAVDETRYQFLGRGGASTDLWADPNFDAWSLDIVSPCAEGSESPDRIVLTISSSLASLNDGKDPQLWADMIGTVIATARTKYPDLKSILLQPVVGGPANALCPRPDDIGGDIRATVNHPIVWDGIQLLVGGDIAAGLDAEVTACSDYIDATGHLTVPARGVVGELIGSYYGALDAE